LEGFSGRALAVLDLPLGEQLAVRVGAGAGLDVVHKSPRLEGSAGTIRGTDEDFALFIARASAAVLWSFASHVSLALMLSSDIDPSGSRYVTLVDGVAAPVLSPWPVRPALALGVTIQPFL
jgi:hypothetical protein